MHYTQERITHGKNSTSDGEVGDEGVTLLLPAVNASVLSSFGFCNNEHTITLKKKKKLS